MTLKITLDTTEQQHKSMLICGLMSGTSLDGVDAAIAAYKITETGEYSVQMLHHTHIPFSDTIRQQALLACNKERSSVAIISQLNVALSHLYAEAVQQACAAIDIPVTELDAIGMHGQTIWHEPEGNFLGDSLYRHTLQIGSATTLATLLQVAVVHDFRSGDVALGGQGAPLVPIFDAAFLQHKQLDTVALNIGGIANITIIPAGSFPDSIKAFDTGPGNVLIDAAMRFYFGKRFDNNGDFAAAGRVLPRFLEILCREQFINKIPPKSTGREYFNWEYVEAAMFGTVFDFNPAEDVIRTLTEFTAWSIAENIRLFANPASRIIASGGGTLNKTLMSALSTYLPQATILTSDEVGIPSSAKEALCFGFLAYLTLLGKPGNVPSVTGASRKAVLGSVALPPEIVS